MDNEKLADELERMLETESDHEIVSEIRENQDAILAALRTKEPSGDGGLVDGSTVCANCKGMIDDLTPGREPEELCDTCYTDILSSIANRANNLSDDGGLACYDAGLLPEPFGASDEWWQDAMRVELARAHEFYADQFANPNTPTTDARTDESSVIKRLRNQARRLHEEANLDERAAVNATNADAVPHFNSMAASKRTLADDILALIEKEPTP